MKLNMVMSNGQVQNIYFKFENNKYIVTGNDMNHYKCNRFSLGKVNNIGGIKMTMTYQGLDENNNIIYENKVKSHMWFLDDIND